MLKKRLLNFDVSHYRDDFLDKDQNTTSSKKYAGNILQRDIIDIIVKFDLYKTSLENFAHSAVRLSTR